MKLFAAALALSSALISPVYGVVESDPNTEVATCDGEWEVDRITELDFYKSTVATNTLHLEEGELRFANIGTFQNDVLDLRITVTGGDYTDIAQVWIDKNKGPSKIGDPDEMNGKTTGAYFGNINLQTTRGNPQSGEGNFRFCIVKSGTNVPQSVERFSWTVYDTDQRGSKIREKLFIDVQDLSSYQLVEDTEIEVSCEDGSATPCDDGVRTQFLSTRTGTGSDNPTTPDDLSDLQLKRSIQFNFENTDCWEITYDHFCEYEHQDNPSQEFCNNYTGGNFLFAGSSERITEQGDCITPPPTDAPTVMPVALTSAPSASPTIGSHNTPPTAPTPGPDYCAEDVQLLQIDGVTEIPLANAVVVTKQDKTAVEVRLTNAWTTPDLAIESIFYSYQKNSYDKKCYEKTGIAGGNAYANITIQCLHLSPYARLEICVADSDGALSDGDNATVPKCCHPELTSGTDVVCYELVVWCETQCIDATQRRSLRGAADISL